MTDVMAAMGLRQLDRYPELLEHRIEIIKKYDVMCKRIGISYLVHHTKVMDSSNHLYLLRIPGVIEKQRNEIINKLAEQGISTNVHYKPLPMMQAYKHEGIDIKDYLNAYNYYQNLITLPLHSLLSDKDVDYVIKVFEQIINEYI